MRKPLLLLSTALLLAGCTAWESLTPPEVSLVDLEFTDLTVFETTGVFTVRLTNENPQPLTVSGGVFSLFLNGSKVGKGLTSEVLEIPQLGTATQEVTVHVSNIRLVTRLASIMEEPVLDYQIRSKLYLERPTGTRRVKSTFEGTFRFDDAQESMPPEMTDG